VDEAEVLARDLARVRSVLVADPDVVGAAAVADVGEVRAVGAVARLPFPRGPSDEELRLAARDRHAPEVAEQVEDERRAVGAHVDLQPGPLVGVDLDLARRAVLGGHVPRLVAGGERECRDQRREEKDRQARVHGVPRLRGS
jgi:hypothetical protein